MIRDIKHYDIEWLTKLHCEEFVNNHRHCYDKYINALYSNNKQCKIIETDNKKKKIGFVLFTTTTNNDLIKRYNKIKEFIPNNYENIIYIDAIIIVDKYRTKGYGQALMNEVLKYAEQNMYKCIVTAAVQTNITTPKVNSEKLLLNNNFKRLNKQKLNIWEQNEFKNECPVCSPYNKSCQCTSVLFIKYI